MSTIRANTIQDASGGSNALGKTRSGITQCCMGTAKSAHGFRWAYKE